MPENGYDGLGAPDYGAASRESNQGSTGHGLSVLDKHSGQNGGEFTSLAERGIVEFGPPSDGVKWMSLS